MKAHIITLRVIVVALLVFLLLFWFSAEKAREEQRLYVPPDMRFGKSVKVNEVDPATVYAFALNIFQVLNVWEHDGRKDYKNNIFKLSYFLTPTYQSWLYNDVNKRISSSELYDRMRFITPINNAVYNEKLVQVIDKNNWIVWLDMQITEYAHAVEVKRVKIRYPVKVTRTDLGPELNPWGLQLNGYAHNPEVIPDKKAKEH